MSTSYYIWPNEVHFGYGTVAKVGPSAKAEGATHVFVLADPGVVAAKLVDPILASLQNAGLAYTLYDKVEPNPSDTSVDAAVAAYRASGADLIVGVGGGSGLDTAKALMLVAGGPADAKVAEYAYRMGDKARPCPKVLPSFIAIPTTAGTGAEATSWAVITDPVAKMKFGVGHPRSMPTIAIIDPELMLGLPPFLTAATGMDALSHCIEAYVSKNWNPMLDAMALQGIRLIAQSLPVAVAQGDNRQAREDMAHAAFIGGVAISSKLLGACHSLAHQLSSLANVHHGLACSLMLPHQMTYSLPGAIERYAAVAEALGVPATGSLRQRAERGIEAVTQLAKDCNLPTRLSDVNVPESVIPAMAKYAYTVDSNWWTNPRSVNEKVMEQLYRAAF